MTRRRARTVIARELSASVARCHDDASWRDLGADSLDMVTIPAALENEFGIRLGDAEVEFCQTVGTAIDLVETKLENRRLRA